MFSLQELLSSELDDNGKVFKVMQTMHSSQTSSIKGERLVQISKKPVDFNDVQC
jgi:hypothetical protein